MKMKHSLGAALFLSSCALFAAPPRVAAVKADGAIKLDGIISEKAWNAAAWQGNFTVPGKTQAAAQPTRFKIMAGRNGLYMAIKAVDNDIFTAMHEHDFALWNNDCIEIFMTPVAEPSPDRNIREHKQFVFNVSGCQYEQASRGGVADTSWNNPWQVAVKRSNNGFDAEVFIPYYVMKPAVNAKTWRFNVGREDVNKKRNAHDLSVWSASKQFAEHDNFGYLVNIPADFSAYQTSLQSPELSLKLADGKVQPAVSGNLAGQPGKRYSVKAAILDAKGKVAAFNAVEKVLPKSGEMAIVIPVDMRESGKYTLQSVVIEENGRIVDWQDTKVEFSAATLNVELAQPCYRNNIYLALPDPKLALTVKSLADPAQLGNAKLAVTVAAMDKVIAQKSVNAPKTAEGFVFDAAKWAPGSYTVTAELSGAGKSDGKFVTPFNVIAPARGNVITLDAKRNVLVNGKEFFPRGFLGGPGDLKAQKAAGCNIVQFYMLHFNDIDAIIRQLDELQQLGMMGALVPRHKIRSSFFGFYEGTGKKRREVKTLSAETYDAMEKLVNAIKEHPAFFGWYLYDEPRGAELALELKRQYEFLRRIDPNHPVLGLDNSAAGCVNKKNHCDIHILDMYPSPDKQNQFGIELAVTASAISTIERGVGNEGVWYCPQAFDRDCYARGSNNHRAMSFVETRCTVWGAIAAGATGIFPFKVGHPDVKYFQRHPNSGIYASPEMHLGWLQGLMPELKNLTPVLLTPALPVKAEPADAAALRVTARKYNGKNFVAAANMKGNAVKIKLSWPDKSAANVRVLGEKRQVKVVNGIVSEVLAPYGVAIYTDDAKYPEGWDKGEVERKIKAALKAAGR